MFTKQVVLAVLATVSFSAHAVPVEHIINGSFTDPNTTTQAGWSTTSTHYIFEGSYRERAFDTFGALSQTVVGANGEAVLSFDFATRLGYQKVWWNGIAVSTLYGNLPMQHYSFNVQATGHDV